MMMTGGSPSESRLFPFVYYVIDFAARLASMSSLGGIPLSTGNYRGDTE